MRDIGLHNQVTCHQHRAEPLHLAHKEHYYITYSAADREST